jgi:hypothetical protein
MDLSALHLRLLHNPSRDALKVDYTLMRAADVTLRLIDVQGRQILRSLETGASAGPHHMDVSAADAWGRPLPSGMYIVQLETPWRREALRWVLLR